MSKACSLMKNVSMQCSMAWMPATRSSAQCAESKKALSTGAKFCTPTAVCAQKQANSSRQTGCSWCEFQQNRKTSNVLAVQVLTVRSF